MSPGTNHEREAGKSFTIVLLLVSWGECNTPHRASQEKHTSWLVMRQREGGELWGSVFIVVSAQRNSQGGLGVANLKNFSRLWGITAVAGCLVPGPGAIRVNL